MPAASATNIKAYGAVLAANLLFGINFSIVKLISPKLIPPFGLNFIRVAVTVVLFWLLFTFKPGKAGIRKKDIPRFLLCAITGVAINQLLFIKGLTLTTPVHAALLILITPVFILITAVVTGSERLSHLKLAGLLLGIGGSVLLILSKESSAIGSNLLWGDILVVINAISYAFYFLLVKPLMQQYTALQVIRWVFTFGLILIIPFCWQQFVAVNWGLFDTGAWLALAFVVLGATFFAYLFTVYGLQHLSASATGAFIYLQPIFSSAFSFLVFGEVLTASKIVAAVLIFTGVYLVNKKKLS
ncbi:DMT family transporter [Lacibacter sp. MH-610]|uniref:DMT family transporter n=1 Tax=Lacibacter sp. MH-610 TaxID=3020883 RepID=UPI00389293D7